MLYDQLDALFGTLRFRLTFWNTAAILLLVLATLIGLRLGLRSFLEREMDRLLAEDQFEVKLILERFHPNWTQIREELDRKAVSHKARAWYVRVFDERGAMLVATTGAPELVIGVRDAPAGAFDAAGYRVMQRQLALHKAALVVNVGASRDFVNDDVANLTKILVVAGLAFLVVAPLSGYFLAGRATAPLAVILQTAARLRPGRLHERVPLGGSGDELDRLAATLNDLLDRLAAHVESQRAFVANAAHELRSPLAALRTSAEVALGQERSPDEYRELLADVVEGCDNLGGLVNQLLLLAEGDAGLVRSAEPVPLAHLAALAVDMFQGSAEVRGLRLRLDVREPVIVHGSDSHLRRIVSNLIDNAIKFTPEGGEIVVRVRRVDQTAILQVRDTGIGISAADLPHVFERFYRADKARRRELSGGGNGLGLSICQALVGAHGGKIHLDSRPDSGTVATVILPVGSDSDEASPPEG